MASVLPQAQLIDLRKRILAGEDPSDEEIADILATLRAQRGNISAAKSASTKKAAANLPIDLNALFDKGPKQ